MTRLSAAGRRLKSLARGLTWPERAAAIIVAGAMVFGLAEIGSGIYIKVKAGFAQILLERAWHRARAGETNPRPWPWADTWPVARITVPRISKSTVVLAGASGEAMAFGPGHIAGTPMPGMPGIGVISGHRDTHFAFLRDLVNGDDVIVSTADGRDFDYRVTATDIVRADRSGIDPNGPGRGLALVTCYPFDSYARSPKRFVVFADLVGAAGAPSRQSLAKRLGDPLRVPDIADRKGLAVAQSHHDRPGPEQPAER